MMYYDALSRITPILFYLPSLYEVRDCLEVWTGANCPNSERIMVFEAKYEKAVITSGAYLIIRSKQCTLLELTSDDDDSPRKTFKGICCTYCACAASHIASLANMLTWAWKIDKVELLAHRMFETEERLSAFIKALQTRSYVTGNCDDVCHKKFQVCVPDDIMSLKEMPYPEAWDKVSARESH